MECSHVSGKQWAINFFGLASAFRTLLNIIDDLDGIRKIFNQLSTLSILSNEENSLLSDDEEYAQRQSIRCVMVALKRYFETHLSIKADLVRRIHNGSKEMPGLSHSKAIHLSAMQVEDKVQALFEMMPWKSRWTAVDNFVQLGGVTKCIQVIAIAYDWTFSGRPEMVKSALDVLSICSISPRGQLQLCERVELPDDTKSVAFNVLLGAAEGEVVHVSPEITERERKTH